jgi:hypothetical protein
LIIEDKTNGGSGMIREIKRMLCSRSVLQTAGLLMLLDLILFWMIFGGNAALYEEQSTLFAQIKSGEVSEDVLREELEELNDVHQFFAFENAKQNHPEFYEMVYHNKAFVRG